MALAAVMCLAACVAVPPPAALSADDRTAIVQITVYLNALHSFHADFVQQGPDGISQGEVWLQRPGRLAVNYTRPRPKRMLARQGRLKLIDDVNGATTNLPLSRTPLDILLAATIALTDSVTITRLQRLPDALQLSLVKTASPGQGTLTLRFSADPLALQGVTVVDRNGQTTAFDLSGLQPNIDVDPARFIDRAPATARQ